MSAEFPGQRPELTVLSTDFDLASPELVEQLNATADALRVKAELYSGLTLGGIAISGDSLSATFETINYDPYVRRRLGLLNPFPVGGVHGRTIESDNVTVLTRREIRPFMIRGQMTNRMACDSFTYLLVADAEGLGDFARTVGLRTDDNDIVGGDISMRRKLAPLFLGSATHLLGRLLRMDEILTSEAP